MDEIGGWTNEDFARVATAYEVWSTKRDNPKLECTSAFGQETNK